jgi:hypothetical protein
MIYEQRLVEDEFEKKVHAVLKKMYSILIMRLLID